jgi:2Fe-2S ferredoxin
MPAITYLLNDGATRTVDVPVGATVMETAISHRIAGIVAVCGGALCCATCHVYVDPAWLPKLAPASELEDEMLDLVAAERRPTSRLSCQIAMTDALSGLVVVLPDKQVAP